MNLDVIAQQLFDSVKGRFGNLTIGDENGDITNVAKEARFFDFDFGPQDKPLGKVSVSLDEENGLVIIYNKDMIDENYGQNKNDWFNFLKDMRMFSKRRLLKFEVRDITRSNLQKRDYKFLATNRPGEKAMSESKMYGTNKTSFQKFGSAKLSIKHNGTIDEGENRTKKIGSIFIENSEGEKFKYPYKHLSGARAMAQHVGEGGHPYDDFGKHISGLSEELSKLRKFNQYMNRSTVMAETLSEYTGTVKERMISIKKEINNLQKPAYYAEALDNFTPAQVNEVPSEVAENWIDQLTVKQFNEELKDVFPYIYNLVSESTLAETVNPEDLLGEFNLGKLIGLPQGVKPNDFVKKATEISNRYQSLVTKGTSSSAEQSSKMLHELYMELINLSREIQKMGGGNGTMINAQQQLKTIKAAARGDGDAANRLVKAAQYEPKLIIDFVKQDIQSIGESQGLEEAEDTYHKVAPGETLTSIAQQYADHFPGGVQQGVEEIQDANGIANPKLIQVGTELVIPRVSAPAKQIGASPTTPGATRGQDPKDVYSPDDLKRLTNPSMESAFESALDKLLGQFAETLTPSDEEWSKLLRIPNRETWEKLIKQAKAKGDKKMLGKLMAMGQFSEQMTEDHMKGYENYHCKDCGCQMHNCKPDCNCPHDSHDESGDWWVDKDGNGVPDKFEGNAYAHAVRQAKMNGKKKGDKVKGPDGDEITLEKEKTPLGEFILSYFDRENGTFPKGPTAVLTMVEKEYGEQYVRPAQEFIERIDAKVAEVMGYKDTDMEESKIGSAIDTARDYWGSVRGKNPEGRKPGTGAAHGYMSYIYDFDDAAAVINALETNMMKAARGSDNDKTSFMRNYIDQTWNLGDYLRAATNDFTDPRTPANLKAELDKLFKIRGRYKGATEGGKTITDATPDEAAKPLARIEMLIDMMKDAGGKSAHPGTMTDDIDTTDVDRIKNLAGM